MLNRAWKWLLARSTSQILIFQMIFWMPVCVTVFAWVTSRLHVTNEELIIWLIPVVYTFFLPLLFECVKDHHNSR